MKKFSLLAVLAAVFATAVALAAPASAHVTVNSPGATAGGYAVLTFRVPTESDTASTTKLAVSVPKFQSVSVQRVAGWTYSVKKSGDTVTEIDWTADGADNAIKPGEFGQFPISVGPLPKTKSVSFGAIQTYSDGSVVQWNQTAAAGSDTEPEHPKPTLVLAAADTTTASSSSSSDSSDKDDSSSTAPTILSIIALVLAAGALGVAFVGNARRRKSTA